MVRDLEAAGDLLADSDLVAAIAGDAYAQQLVAAEPDRDDDLGPRLGRDVDAPENDYSVLDADSSQRSAIDSVVAGRSLVIHGPPGTGKSQTIANLIAAMVARGRKVLFVADGAAARGRAAPGARAVAAVGLPGAVGAARRPGGGPGQRAAVRAGGDHPRTGRPDPRRAARVTRLGGFAMRPGSTPWFGAAIGTRAQAHEAIELAVTLSSRTLPQVAARLAAAAGELGLPDAGAFSYPERTRLTRVLALLHQAGQPGRGFRERRALRRQAQAEWAALLSARSAGGAAAEPRLPSGYAALAQAWDECSRQLAALRALAPLAGLEDAPEAATAALAADQETPWKLPRLRELAAAFGARGLAPLLDEVGDESVAPDEVAAAFDYAWHRSILDQIRIRDPDYGAEYGAALDEIAADFRLAFFAEDLPEPFFVKNLERVQGDERDAIILSVGYGKHRDGRMRYQWGPLLRSGGERRLNVAATRAKRRLTVVSSFASHDVDPGKLTKPGARLLAEYLEYARAGGVPVAASGSGTGSRSAFEADVAARLASLGITLVPQYGVGGYRVDFAAAHPDDPSQMILAVEADGAGVPRLRQRPRSRPAPQGAPGTARLAGSTGCGPPAGSATPRPSWPSSRPPTPKPSAPIPRPRHPRRLCPTTRRWPTNPYLPTTRRRPPTSWHPRPTLFPTAPR